MVLEPQKPLLQPEESTEVRARILPKPGFGEGEFSKDTATLDLLKGYRVFSLDKLNWKSKLGEQVNSQLDGKEFVFPFKPNLGTGTYQIGGEAMITLKEMDDYHQVQATGIGNNHVAVAEGFKILFPENKFVYPIGATAKIYTTLDTQPEEWKKITWEINEKPLDPQENPPLRLPINTTEQVTLTATYKPDGNQEVKAEVKFSGRKITIALTPGKWVTNEKKIPVGFEIKLDNSQTPINKDSFDWHGKYQAKLVGAIYQTYVKTEEGKIELKPGNDPLKPIAEFEKEGALTVLATATLEIFIPKSRAAKGHLPASTTFDLPGGRADLWSYPPIKWDKVNGFLPTEALSESGRTFWMKSGQFTFQKKPYLWTEKDGLKPTLVLEPGLSDSKRTMKTKNHMVTNTLRFTWEGPDNQNLPGHKVIMMFPKKSKEKVFSKLAISFDEFGNLALDSTEIPVTVSALDDLVEAVVYPPEFYLPETGGNQELTFKLIPKGSDPSLPAPFPVKVLNGAYEIHEKSYSWAEGNQFLGAGNPLIYSWNPTIPPPTKRMTRAPGSIITSMVNLIQNEIVPGEIDNIGSQKDISKTADAKQTEDPGFEIVDPSDGLKPYPSIKKVSYRPGKEVQKPKNRSIFAALDKTTGNVIPVDWEILNKEPGPMRKKILQLMGVSDGNTIGFLANGVNEKVGTSILKNNSIAYSRWFLSGDATLRATNPKTQKQKEIRIQVSQPKIQLSLKRVKDGQWEWADRLIFFRKRVIETWGMENIFTIDRLGSEPIEIENFHFDTYLPQEKSAEVFLLPSKPNFHNILGIDSPNNLVEFGITLEKFNTNGIFGLTRQTLKILQTGRDTENLYAFNVYLNDKMQNALYEDPLLPKPLTRSDGITVYNGACYEKRVLDPVTGNFKFVPIVDEKLSGIIIPLLIPPNQNPETFEHSRTLAHEMGHLLLHQGGKSDHEGPIGNLMRPLYENEVAGIDLLPEQFIRALDYDNSRGFVDE